YNLCQAEDGIRDRNVTGVQTCALPILQAEVAQLAALSGTVPEGPAKGRPRIDSDIDACETVLMLDPVCNGEVSVRGWQALGEKRSEERRVGKECMRRWMREGEEKSQRV